MRNRALLLVRETEELKQKRNNTKEHAGKIAIKVSRYVWSRKKMK